MGEHGGPLCPLFDLSLQMTQQEIKDERALRLLSNKQQERVDSFSDYV